MLDDGDEYFVKLLEQAWVNTVVNAQMYSRDEGDKVDCKWRPGGRRLMITGPEAPRSPSAADT